VRFTATRHNESSRMHSSELDGDVWTIPGERYKTKLDHVIPLTAAAKALIGEKPVGIKGKRLVRFLNYGRRESLQRLLQGQAGS
jgi:hypothetical protein